MAIILVNETITQVNRQHHLDVNTTETNVNDSQIVVYGCHVLRRRDLERVLEGPDSTLNTAGLKTGQHMHPKTNFCWEYSFWACSMYEVESAAFSRCLSSGEGRSAIASLYTCWPFSNSPA